jgi:hypothetical protein
MWTIAEYQPTALFSLRPATATTSGGKTLIVPSPFAIKMGLLDVAIRTLGFKQGKSLFTLIRDLDIAIRPSRWIVINKTFIKILRYKEIKSKASEKETAILAAKRDRQWPYYRTIAYREYVHFSDNLSIAFQETPRETLVPLLTQINYFGKRGGFIQLQQPPETMTNLPKDFTMLTRSIDGSFPLGILQILDDFGEQMTFEHANIYHVKNMRAKVERIFHQVVLPYRAVRSSRSFTLYQRID